MMASGDGHLEIVRTLLEKGANVEAESYDVRRALCHTFHNPRTYLLTIILD